MNRFWKTRATGSVIRAGLAIGSTMDQNSRKVPARRCGLRIGAEIVTVEIDAAATVVEVSGASLHVDTD